MAAGSRRLFAMLLAGSPLLSVALSLQAVDVRAAGPLTVTAQVGYAGVIKPQQWMPVAIAVSNLGSEVDGTLEVQSFFGGKAPVAWPASYERPLVLAAGATKYFRSYLLEDAGLTVSVRVVRSGRVLAQQNAAPARTASTLVGVLSDDSTALDDLALVHVGSLVASVVHLGLADLADSSIALSAFDLLAIDDFATESLTARQQTALAEFVQIGGSLLIGTGSSWRRTLGGLPGEIVPIRVGGLTTLTPSPALGGLSGVQVATGSLAAGAAWLSEGGQPLLIESRIGSGSVTLAAFDWKQEPVSNWPGTVALLRQVLVRTVFGSQLGQGPGQSFGGPFGGPFGQDGSIYQRSSSLSPVLGNLPALDLPSLLLTGVLVLVYVLLVGPVNYLVLGVLHRRSLAWITLPVIAVIVAGSAYGGGLLIRGQSVQVNQVSILHVEPGSGVGHEETYTGVLTPTRGDYEVGIGRGALLVSPLSSFAYNGFGGATRADVRVNVDDGTILLPGMTAFTLRGFAIESITAVPRLTAHLREVNGQLVGSVQNQSATSFVDAVVVAGDNYQKIGAIPPGATVQVGLAPKVVTFNGPPAIYSIYPNNTLGPPPNQPSEAQREGQARTQVLTLLQGSGFKGVPSAGILPVLVAWTDQSFRDLTVNGAHPRAHVQTAVAMALPVGEVGTGQLPAGLIGGRVVDFEGEAQQGPPGGLLVQSGSVTLEFNPHLAAGLHLSGATLTSSSLPFAKGPAVANGSAMVQGSAWDWSAAGWVDIGYQETGVTKLPAAVVNPATGEVRLRVTVSNGGFLASGISLTGGVE